MITVPLLLIDTSFQVCYVIIVKTRAKIRILELNTYQSTWHYIVTENNYLQSPNGGTKVTFCMENIFVRQHVTALFLLRWNCFLTEWDFSQWVSYPIPIFEQRKYILDNITEQRCIIKIMNRDFETNQKDCI